MLLERNSELRQIIGVTLRMSFFSTLFSAGIGIPLGMLVGSRTFWGKRALMRILNTLMGLPPVVAGLLVFFLLSRSGPLGQYKLLYSVSAMVIAQVLLILPIAMSLSASIAASRASQIHDTIYGLGLSRMCELRCLLYESRGQLFSILFTCFGRSIAEVGAVSLVGGNVQYKTRVMTTAIMLETNKGNFEFAVALGAVLLLISFAINSIALTLEERGRDDMPLKKQRGRKERYGR
ncbi:MAG: ABC transporter permease [Clostridia bacterium]|nr:ABC transporter permease [Clostridia bacterium]